MGRDIEHGRWSGWPQSRPGARATWLGSALAVAVLTAAAGAQVRPVQMGNALDANPNVGSGGANNPVPGYVPINGNDYITGNVTGLKYFHGNIPYQSPYEFHGTLGTSTLNDFARQSAVGPTFQGTYTGQAAPYYLPSTIVSTYSGRVSPIAASGAARSGFDSSIVGFGSTNPLGAVYRPAPVNAQIPVLPLGALLPGRNYSDLSNTPPLGTGTGSEVSPLFGLREETEPGRLGTSPQPKEPKQAKPEEPEDKNGPSINRPLEKKPGSLAPEQDKSGQPYNDLLDPFHRGTQPLGAGYDARIGPRINAAVTGQEPPVELTKVTPPGAAQKTPGTDAYADLMTRLRGRMEGEARGTIDSATGLPRTPKEPEYQSVDPAKPNYRPRSMMMPEMRREDPTVLQAGRDIQPLETFAGKQLTPVNQLLKQAEGQLHDGKYLEAAETYQRAIAVEPDNALAVVGRAHAELAAGMYESAAYDLRFIFDRKPALTAVHYDLTKFLSPKRINFVVKDLTGLASKAGADSAVFLLAYMHYQMGQTEPLKELLDAWAQVAPQNRWPAILKKAWLEPKAASKPAEKGKP